jgi:hypothetical protein
LKPGFFGLLIHDLTTEPVDEWNRRSQQLPGNTVAEAILAAYIFALKRRLAKNRQ